MCTGIRIVCEDGTVIFARTMEFPKNFRAEVIVIPRNFEFVGDTYSPATGYTWRSKYGVLGHNGGEFANRDVWDGFNEAGLYGGLFAMEPDFTKYAEVTETNVSRVVSPVQYLTWILTSFASVQEVKEHAHEVLARVMPAEELPVGSEVHWFVGDHTGSIVLEFIGGELKIFDAIGVVTNSPNYDWHLTNLRNYANLRAGFQEPVHLRSKGVDHVVKAAKGTGFRGLPGDFTPPSRFVRAVAFSQSLPSPKAGDDGILQAVHILNNFDIPDGSTANNPAGVGGEFPWQTTQWTVYSDVTNKRYVFKSKENQQLKGVQWQEDLFDQTELSFFPMLSPGNLIQWVN
eukprot:jgi/Botrbrau1/14943/Bobra.0018s0047.1